MSDDIIATHGNPIFLFSVGQIIVYSDPFTLLVR